MKRASAHHSIAVFDEWGFEGMSPSWLGQHEWISRSLTAGQKFVVAYYPMKDGRKVGLSLAPMESERTCGRTKFASQPMNAAKY